MSPQNSDGSLTKPLRMKLGQLQGDPFLFPRKILLGINLVILTDEGFTSRLLRGTSFWIKPGSERSEQKLIKVAISQSTWKMDRFKTGSILMPPTSGFIPKFKLKPTSIVKE